MLSILNGIRAVNKKGAVEVNTISLQIQLLSQDKPTFL